MKKTNDNGKTIERRSFLALAAAAPAGAQSLPAFTSTPAPGGGQSYSLSLQTLLLLTSPNDHVVEPAQADFLQSNYGGPIERVLLERSYHVATQDYDKQLVFDRTVEFARRFTANGHAYRRVDVARRQAMARRADALAAVTGTCGPNTLPIAGDATRRADIASVVAQVIVRLLWVTMINCVQERNSCSTPTKRPMFENTMWCSMMRWIGTFDPSASTTSTSIAVM